MAQWLRGKGLWRWLRGRRLWQRVGCWRRGHSPGDYTLHYRGRACWRCMACGKLLPAGPPTAGGRRGPVAIRINSGKGA